MAETERGNSNESILKAAERLRNKRRSRTETETMDLIHELEIRRVQLDMQKSWPDNGRSKSDVEKFISIYDHAPMGYFIMDAGCTISSINFRGAEMLGRERTVLLKSNFRDFVSKKSISAFDDFLQKLLETNSTEVCNIWIQRDPAEAILAHIEGVKSFRDGDYLLTALDITEREYAQEKLKSSEIRYRRLFESALVGILILDGVNGKILDVNPFLINLLGYSYDELLGKYLWEIGIAISTSQSLNAVTELLENGSIYIDNLPLKNKSGKTLFVEVAGVLFTAGDIKVIQINFHDITGRKISEEKLKENEVRLNEMIATKDKFFSIIAHDLKSSFHSIIGIGSLLSEKVQKRDYEEIEEFAEIIQSSSWKAMNLLTNLLEWSRSQTGRIEFNPVYTEVHGIISEVFDLVKESASEKLITISVESAKNAVVFCDKPMVSTILRNLITNSIKFTHRGGRIIVTVIRDDNESTIIVSDNGIGIKKEVIQKLFRIEESFSTEGTDGEKGTGMGLLLCKDFIDRHRGRIWAESEEGEGCRFIFTLPETKAFQSSSS